MGLRKILDKMEPEFHSGGKYENWYALYEAVDTIFYRPSSVTKTNAHVRDAVDMKRIMILVWMCTFPAMFFGMYNIGLQANSAMDAMGVDGGESWRHAIIGALTTYDVSSVWDNMIYGAMYFLPVYLTTFVVGGFWEVLFAAVRKHEVNEGFFVTSILFSLSLPATIPLWQVALGITFGVVLGKEVFGGTGKNFLNPALAGRAFLFFAYPASMSGDAVWTAVDGFSGATMLSQAAAGGVDALSISWSDAFFGFVQGSMGETSTLAILIGGCALLIMRIANWRIVAGVMLGMVLTSLLFNAIGSDTNPMLATPWYWHLVMGGFAFGMMYMATDPVSASMTNKGKLFYGALIGVMVVLIRVVNPAYPEGMMLAILFANLFAPFIDHFIVQANIKRRIARNG
ncbi:NADH:ubiquinone reductase (Na(+)-transporting) subunit B [Marinomonas mediterranea]|jgi:NADH:ubiquinone oxidoreductase, Na(+)-translocating, B subunit|uniref:Na(+)-translocating NADH-quinone reductase subunit B n=1 Tax=Marinomonas mediterranea (strain ATCC 700492 / JCM 21426 / NBRC 103028 / MMB-1) TaxID=717774 RepID=F2JWQ7_MARM1|nr:NADH:ubiquinone reductase (Na(+)-transporting) subunit B [Marinomonas mediterranea]ADZ91821.1 Na(+)-translocating NADH-quinone reductase subunit B [Marinomonas mediterranea MMB-1]WCN09775.1 NADH:ubiquinone reductase (Na(+)-transporting) subunit B [Marinomonas mediterranea]WCN13857.1 NADH:ubiquinone reductase (Na(+)-transporting) subunit B [Marinomonas mediterranea]WCN17913.1 NADH:ubiquinone reductase (Na(+)-transporting) subunit B [Marinomonas mediterranea MMB-1]